MILSRSERGSNWCFPMRRRVHDGFLYLRTAAVWSSNGVSEGIAISTGGNSSDAPSGVCSAPPCITASTNLHSSVGIPSRAACGNVGQRRNHDKAEESATKRTDRALGLGHPRQQPSR